MDKFNYLKEQLTAALATWQQTNGGKTTVGWMHAANPEVIAALLAELEDERASREQWQQNCRQAEDRITEMEKRLAMPIKIVNYDEFFICHVSGASDDYCKGWVDERNAAARDVGKAGFSVEGR